jgi:hypothetical protein
MSKSYRAAVEVVMRIELTDSWGDDCTMAQIEKQAIDGANGVLHKILAPTGDKGAMGEVPAAWKDAAVKLVKVGKLVGVTVRPRDDR